MNERIKELAEQASLKLFDDTAQYRLLKGFAEKFAELIVRECAQVAEEVDGDSRARKCVLEHFGVKE